MSVGKQMISITGKNVAYVEKHIIRLLIQKEKLILLSVDLVDMYYRLQHQLLINVLQKVGLENMQDGMQIKINIGKYALYVERR